MPLTPPEVDEDAAAIAARTYPNIKFDTLSEATKNQFRQAAQSSFVATGGERLAPNALRIKPLPHKNVR